MKSALSLVVFAFFAASVLSCDTTSTATTTGTTTGGGGCNAWNGGALVHGQQVKIYSVDYSQWVTYGTLPFGTGPTGLYLTTATVTTATTFTFNNPSFFTYAGSGTQGQLLSPSGGEFCGDYGGNDVTYAGSSGCVWNFAFVPNGAAPNVKLWKSQKSASWGWVLGTEIINSYKCPTILQSGGQNYQLYVC